VDKLLDRVTKGQGFATTDGRRNLLSEVKSYVDEVSDLFASSRVDQGTNTRNTLMKVCLCVCSIFLFVFFAFFFCLFCWI
jgi:hypothetical protein